MTPFSLGLITAMVCGVAALTLLTVRAYAVIDNVGPSASEYGGANAFYELSNTPNLVSTSMAVPVYFPTKPAGNVGVAVSYGNDGGGATGSIRLNGGATNNPGSVTLAPGSFTIDAATGYYRAIITAAITGGVTNTNYRLFRLNAPGSGLIGYTTSGNSNHFAVGNAERCDQPPVGNKNSGCGRYYNYKLPFAPSCTTTPRNPTQVQIFDGDNPSPITNQTGIQPKPFTVTIRDTTTGANVAKSESGTWGNGGTRTISFNAVRYHHYEADLNGVYANNVIQFKLPYDSINTLVSCPTGGIFPSGGAGASVSGYCTAIEGYMYDADKTSAAMQYFVYVNPPAGTPTTYPSQSNAPGIAAGFRGPGPANKPNPTGTPAGVPANHGFVINIPADVQQYNYNGPGAANTYWVYGKSATESNLTRIGAVTVAPCGYRPFFTVVGGDITAGNGFNAAGACSAPAAASIQSWNQDNAPANQYGGAGSGLGAFSTGSITNFVSGSATAGGANTVDGHGLSFGNNTGGIYVTPATYGKSYGAGTAIPSSTLPCVHDYQADAAPAARAATATDSATLSGKPAGSYSAAGPLVTIGGGTANPVVLSGGRQVTLYVTGNAYITSDITYSYGAIADIPQFRLIVQGNLYIAPGVHDLHGIYIVQKNGALPGNLITCSTGGAVETSAYATCNQGNKGLTFTGAVAVQGKLHLDRTHGSVVADPPSTPAEAAETFRYSPELWLNTANNPTPGPLTYQAFTGLPPVL